MCGVCLLGVLHAHPAAGTHFHGVQPGFCARMFVGGAGGHADSAPWACVEVLCVCVVCVGQGVAGACMLFAHYMTTGCGRHAEWQRIRKEPL